MNMNNCDIDQDLTDMCFRKMLQCPTHHPEQKLENPQLTGGFQGCAQVTN